MTELQNIPPGYPELLQQLKQRIHASQVRAAMSVSREMVLLYWSIGRDILARQEAEGWGARVIDRLARDLQAEFAGVEGFSSRSLKYMRALAEAWPDAEVVQGLIAQLPWGHNVRVLDRIKDRPTREWYLRAALEYGWSQDILVLQIKSRLHEREGKSLTNFQRTLPPPGSDLAEQILKDPYNFDFLTVAKDSHEREIERVYSSTFAIFYLNSVGASHLSAVRPRLLSATTPSTSTCSSIMSGSIATSSSSSRRASSSRSGRASSTFTYLRSTTSSGRSPMPRP